MSDCVCVFAVESSVKDDTTTVAAASALIVLPNLAKHLLSQAQPRPPQPQPHPPPAQPRSPPAHPHPPPAQPHPPLSQPCSPPAQPHPPLSQPCPPPAQTQPSLSSTKTPATTTTLSQTRLNLAREGDSTTSVRAGRTTTLRGSSSCAGTARGSSSELAQPVPLSSLTQHHILPQDSLLTCTLLVRTLRTRLGQARLA